MSDERLIQNRAERAVDGFDVGSQIDLSEADREIALKNVADQMRLLLIDIKQQEITGF